MDSSHDLVRRAAESLGLLESDGKLMPMDSLMVIDLVVALEEMVGARIPVTELEPEVFESLDSVARMLGVLKGRT